MALIQKAFSDIITFSRSSNATRVGPTGLVEYAPHNLLTYSQEFDNAAWTKTSCTATANSSVAPDGTVTADNIITSAAVSAVSNVVAITANTQIYTQSLYVKFVSGYANFRLRAALVNGTAQAVYLSFNAQTGAFVASDGIYTITSVGNGWYRISITIANNGTNTSFAWQVYPTDDVSSTNEMALWGAQLAVGPYALDYTPTTSAAVYGPRFDYDPVTLAPKGLLVEEQRTNLLTYSEQFDNAYWLTGSGSVTVTANATTAPDGTVTADLVIPSAASAFHRIYSPDLGQTTVAYSVFVKAGGYSKIALRESATQGSYISVNLSTGAIIESANVGTGTVSSATVTSFGNGWYRISGYFVTPVNTAWGLVVLPDSYTSGNVTGSWTGNGTSGVYVWGAQAEVASFATSYIPTLASTVTRSADVASVNTLSPWWNNSEGSFYFEGDVALANGQYPGLYKTGTTSGQRVGQFMNSGTTSAISNFYRVTDTVASGSISNQTVFKLASAYSGSELATALNGGAAATASASGSLTLPTILYLGFFDEYMSGHIRRLAYYPRKLSSAELQALSA